MYRLSEIKYNYQNENIKIDFFPKRDCLISFLANQHKSSVTRLKFKGKDALPKQ